MTHKLRRTVLALAAAVALVATGCSSDEGDADRAMSLGGLTTPVVEQPAPETTPTPIPTPEASVDAEDQMWEEAEEILGPIAQSVDAGASPEHALRHLVELSCAQNLANPMYWDYAEGLYWSLVERGTRQELLVGDWPESLAAAMKGTCFASP